MRKSEPKSPTAATTKPVSRRAYREPELKVFGTVGYLTKAVGRRGVVADGGGGRRSKTS
jgi:hypothetical protein